MTRLLLTGASGQLGSYLARELQNSDFEVTAWSGARTGELFGFALHPIDLADAGAVMRAFRDCRPAIVLHVAAMASVADCYRDPDRARRVNVNGSALLAELATQSRRRFVHVSTDLVFDGEKGGYRESDATSPLSRYAQTKVDAEQAVLQHAGTLVVRPSLLFGPTLVGRPTFFDQQLASLRERRPMALFEDEWRTPLSLGTTAAALLALVRSDVTGILHLGGPERLSRLEMGFRLAAGLGLDPTVFSATQRASNPAPEPRPRDVSLDSTLWRSLFPRHPWPRFEEALAESIPPAH